MAVAPKYFDPHLDLFPFTHPLPHLIESINRGRRTKIVAIGSSSTAGEPTQAEPTPGDPTASVWQVRIVPYPARLELALRREHFGCMIDVLNRGLGGQEAPDELARFECDVIAEAPAMVIWQVGGNAVFHNLNLDEVEAAIITGLRWLACLPMDVVMMDLPYTTALTKERMGLSIQVQKIILDAAVQAKVNVFRRWDLMKKWVDDDRVTTIEDLTDPLDDQAHLHMSEWATACVSNALFRTIVAAPPPPPVC